MQQGRRCRELGAGAFEYIGTIVVAAVLVGALVVAVGGGDRVRETTEAAVCTILGRQCETSPDESEDEDVTGALPSCEVYTEDHSLHGELTVFSLNLGGNVSLTLKKEVLPDGRVRWLVQESGRFRGGSHLLFGAKGKFGLGGGGRSLGTKYGTTFQGGRTFAFDSEKEAREYMEAVKQQARKEAAALASPLPRFLDMFIADTVTGTSYEQPGKPVSYYTEIGARRSANAQAGAGGADAGGAMTKTHLLGTRYDPPRDGQPGRVTMYYKATRELAAQLGVLGRGAGGGVEGEVVLAVSFDANGRPVSARIQVAGKVRGGFFRAGSKKIPLGKNASGSAGGDAGAFFTGRVSFELDLTRRGNLRALADLTNSVGMPVLGEYGSPRRKTPQEAVAALRKRFTEGGPAEGATITGQRFEGMGGGLEIGFFAGDLLAFGVGGSETRNVARATDAFYYAPGSGFVQWQGCDGQ